MEKITKLTFPNGRTALAAQVQHVKELPEALDEIGLPSGYPVLVLVGGAKIDSEELEGLRSLFVSGIAPAIIGTGAVIIDGGTDAGVMQLMGHAQAETGGTFPLIGVAPIGKVAIPGEYGPLRKGTALEPHHTHFVLIPGLHFGEESPWLFDVARVLAVKAPVVTILVNGGPIAWEDVSQSVKAGCPVVVFEGSGRTADELARALRDQGVDERASRLVASGLLRAVNVNSDSSALARMLAEMLSTKA